MKIFYTIGCCGIDCGLCPRYHTKGDSACPGCGAPNFKEKHPSCGLMNCCVSKNVLEVCSFCKDFPCKRFDSELKGYDSFVTHKKVFSNHELIIKLGIDSFIDQQKNRMNILKNFLTEYDDGRSKSLFCISCTLLPLNDLQETQQFMNSQSDTIDFKNKNEKLKDRFQEIAEYYEIDLKLIKKNNQ
jgi:hypothetical protein